MLAVSLESQAHVLATYISIPSLLNEEFRIKMVPTDFRRSGWKACASILFLLSDKVSTANVVGSMQSDTSNCTFCPLQNGFMSSLSQFKYITCMYVCMMEMVCLVLILL